MIERREIITPNNEIYMPSRTFDNIKSAKDYSIANPNTICLASSNRGKKVYPDYLDITIETTESNHTETIYGCDSRTNVESNDRIFHDDCEIDWGDGKYDGVTKGTQRKGKSFSHTYIYPGTYHIKVYGAFWEEPTSQSGLYPISSSYTSVYGTYKSEFTYGLSNSTCYSFNNIFTPPAKAGYGHPTLVDVYIPTPSFIATNVADFNGLRTTSRKARYHTIDMSDFDFPAVFSSVAGIGEDFFYIGGYTDWLELVFNDSLGEIPWRTEYDKFKVSNHHIVAWFSRLVLPSKITRWDPRASSMSQYFFNLRSAYLKILIDWKFPTFDKWPTNVSNYVFSLPINLYGADHKPLKTSELYKGIPTPPSATRSISYYTGDVEDWENNIDANWKREDKYYGVIS